MSGIELVVEDPAWRVRGLQVRLKRAAVRAAAEAGLTGAMTILLADDLKLKTLNRDFRGRDRPTNVLSFPSALVDYHGDIALAHGVCAGEAARAGKSMADHACHLVVHGVLHLAGYDHVRAADAKVMQPLEVKILAGLGIANPYRVPVP